MGLAGLLADRGMSLAAISTGRVFAEQKVWMTHPDPSIRQKAVSIVKGLVEAAAPFKSRVNLGRARGVVHEGETLATAETRFIVCMRECADFAAPLGVEILLEPVNRYEINFINSVSQGVALMAKISRPNVKLMPDVFHMNIEDVSITGSFEHAGPLVGYVHFADSNRWAPGQGHLDFPAIVASLKKIGYDGYVTVEILPYPDPDTAAQQAISYLRPLIPRTAS
jgi:sugar phosphate isomerase/epimerase